MDGLRSAMTVKEGEALLTSERPGMLVVARAPSPSYGRGNVYQNPNLTLTLAHWQNQVQNLF